MLIWHAVGLGVDVVVVGEGYARFCVVPALLVPPPPSLWLAMIADRRGGEKRGEPLQEGRHW